MSYVKKRVLTIQVEVVDEEEVSWIWDSHMLGIPLYGVLITAIREGLIPDKHGEKEEEQDLDDKYNGADFWKGQPDMDDAEEMKKFKQGFAYRFHVDSHRVLGWITELTEIHNQIVKGEMFSAGYTLSFLLSKLYDVEKELCKWEKIERDRKMTKSKDESEVST